MRVLREVDRPLLALTLMAVLAGLVVLYTASAGASLPGEAGSAARTLLKRLTHCGVGLALMSLAALCDQQRLRRLILPGALLSAVLLVLVLGSTAIRGTRGWLPVLGQSLQVADVARLALLLLLADRLAARSQESDARRRFLWPLVAVGVAAMLVALQPDFGSALAIGLCGAALILVARPPVRWILAGILAVGLVVGAAYLGSSRVRERVDLVLRFDPNTRSDEGYQLRQSLIGLGAGGILGQGAGQSRQARFLPDNHTDFIFAIVGEEYGLVGTLALLFLLTAIPLRILRLARQQEDDYAFYLAAGVAGMLFVYTALNIAVTLGLFPVTGVPLPFVSHGGSALVVNLCAVGLVLGLSRGGERTVAAPAPRRARRQGEPLLEDLYRSSRS